MQHEDCHRRNILLRCVEAEARVEIRTWECLVAVDSVGLDEASVLVRTVS